jgi:hypothetical protein
MGCDKNMKSIVWVTTISKSGLCSFWDPTSGIQYEKHCEKKPFKTVGCCFNHSNFYANIQPIDHIDKCDFALEKRTLWKSVSPEKISLLERYSKNITKTI